MAHPCGHCGQVHDAYLVACPVTGARLATATYTAVSEDEALVGNVVAERYHVEDILGQGSTGTVFAAKHVHFGRPCAMKVLRARHVPQEIVQRVFHGEARAAWSLSHPSLVEVFDIGTLPEGAPFCVMERLDGDTLAARLQHERLSIAAAVDIMMQVLAALDAVHARDLLVRDLRPQNIFLAQRRGCRPVVKILDFGLGRLVPLEKVQHDWDALRAVVGTASAGMISIPFYVSPERSRGEHGIGPASDLFSAAAVFYEALAGQKPFDGATYNSLVLEISHGQPRPLSALRPDVPEELDALIMRALSSNPQSRPQSAPEMQDELRSAFEGARRGSSSMRTAPATQASFTDPSVQTPVHVERETESIHGVPFPHVPIRRPAAGERPPEPSAATQVRQTMPPSDQTIDNRPAPDRSMMDDYDDETRTDRKLALVEAALDEASADNPSRTVRPPSIADIDVDVDFEHDDPTTSRGTDIATALLTVNMRKPKQADEEDETETMQLTPEVRARIEQMTKTAAFTPPSAPKPREDSSRPPPTRRLTTPKR
ncbi:MAG: serine/threonine protein kinase [Labilithrix sp.]|nr:serine/threonine protein kinase [Labilithrix sp.]